MRQNFKATPPVHTAEGAVARNITIEQQLRRSVLSCLLWENEFYESGDEIAKRIKTLASQTNDISIIGDLAIEARSMGLRHAPLLLLLDLIRRGGQGVANVIAHVIKRPDEITELVHLYWKEGNKKMLPRQLRTGIGYAFNKFDTYQIGKYNRDNPVKLRDAMFLAHAKPDENHAELFKQMAEKTVATPDTWETELSAGKDKKETFERLLRERKLGYLALLRNLRNMANAGVDDDLINEAIIARRGANMVFPFRYVAAVRAAPQYAAALDTALQAHVGSAEQLQGKTIVLVDISGFDVYPHVWQVRLAAGRCRRNSSVSD